MGNPKTKDDLDGILGESPADEPVDLDTLADGEAPEESLTETVFDPETSDVMDEPEAADPAPGVAARPEPDPEGLAAFDAAAEIAVSDTLETADSSAELASARAERDDMRDRFMRALADAENARKRGDKDRREAERYGGSRLARDLLPVYDNVTRALAAARDDEASPKALVEGLELTLREFINVFGKHGITPISPKEGEAFDPQLHQAMFEAPLPGTKAGAIIQVMTEGFQLHDRLLRPAQVGVSSTPAA